MTGSTIVTLDIGSSKIAVLAARADKAGNLEVLAYETVASRGVFRGTLNEVDGALRAVDAAFRRLQGALNAPISKVYVSISGPGVEGAVCQGMKPIVPKTRHITHHDVLEVINHSRSIVLAADREQVQAIPRAFRVDTKTAVLQPIGMTGGRLEVETYLVSAPRVVVANLERVVRGCGKEFEQAILAPLAAGLALLTVEEMENGTAVVDIGAGTTDVAVFVGGSIASSVSFPVGSSLVTSDVAQLLKTSVDEADRLKLAFGSAYAKSVPEADSVQVSQTGHIQPRPMQRRVLAEIIESRMREIATLVRGHLEGSGYASALGGGIVLTGKGSLLAETTTLFDEVIPLAKSRLGDVPPGKIALDAGSAVSLGIAQFVIQCHEEISSASGDGGWRERVRSLFPFFARR